MTMRTLLSHLTDDELICHAESQRDHTTLETELLIRFEKLVEFRSNTTFDLDVVFDEDVV